MNNKRKELAFDIFYNQFKVMETYNFILTVMKSCETIAQLGVAYRWGIGAINGLYEKICRYLNNKYQFSTFKEIDLELYAMNRIMDIEDDMERTYKKLRVEIPE